jgi:hypothetical protein
MTQRFLLFDKKCALTVKFGKDIAGLIYRWVWRFNMNKTNQTYHSVVKFRDNAQSLLYFCSQSLLRKGFNYRSYLTDWRHIYSIKEPMVATLPNNYWQIKELY